VKWRTMEAVGESDMLFAPMHACTSDRERRPDDCWIVVSAAEIANHVTFKAPRYFE
jgi:hypothetical protein